jgi:hypothetical protein
MHRSVAAELAPPKKHWKRPSLTAGSEKLIPLASSIVVLLREMSKWTSSAERQSKRSQNFATSQLKDKRLSRQMLQPTRTLPLKMIAR